MSTKGRMPLSRGALLFVSVLAACVSLYFPSASFANRYGYAELDGGGYNGGDVSISSSKLSVTDYQTLFAANDFWVNNGNYWVEAMINYGTCGGAKNYVFFCWADSRPNGGGYHEHAGPAASLNTTYGDDIVQDTQTPGNWNIDIGGWTGTSTNSFTTSTYLQTGTEVYVNGNNSNATVCSTQGPLYWYDTNFGLHTNWTNGSHNAYFYQDQPPYTYWVTQYSKLRDYENYPSC